MNTRERHLAFDASILLERLETCHRATENYTAQNASAGYARRYSARMTAFFPPRAWCLVSQPRTRATAMY